MIKHYYSERNHPLLYWHTEGFPADCPVITLENYPKWYRIYVVLPTGEVTTAGIVDIIEIENQSEKVLYLDHNFHPELLEKLAEQYRGIVDEVSLEVAAGRWSFEIGNRYK